MPTQTPGLIVGLMAAALLTAGAALAQDPERTAKEVAADASHAADMAMAAFAEGCAPHLDHPQTIRMSMGDVGLKAAPDVVAAQLPHGADDVVWVLPHPGVGVAAVWDMGGAACSVHLQKGDMDTLKKAFTALLENTRKEGVTVQAIAPRARRLRRGAGLRGARRRPFSARRRAPLCPDHRHLPRAEGSGGAQRPAGLGRGRQALSRAAFE